LFFRLGFTIGIALLPRTTPTSLLNIWLAKQPVAFTVPGENRRKE
jgi:hypothetical protein